MRQEVGDNVITRDDIFDDYTGPDNPRQQLTIEQQAQHLAESWLNGNRGDVAEALETSEYGPALACAVTAKLSEPYWEQRADDIAAFMQRRAEGGAK